MSLGNNQNRMSLKEFLVSLIVGSRGTVCDKAAAIFDVYARVQQLLVKGELPYHKVLGLQNLAGNGEDSDVISYVDLEDARAVVENVLGSGLQHLSRRQLAQLADATYHRLGFCAGILDALLVKASMVEKGNETTAKQIRDLHGERGLPILDVKYQVVLEFDKQARGGSGSRPLTFRFEKGSGLADLQIDDPYKGVGKILCLRCVRAGDGERLNLVLHFDGEGVLLETVEVDLDATGVNQARTGSSLLTKLTKQEFVACTLSSPLLADVLRSSCTRAAATRSSDALSTQSPGSTPLRLLESDALSQEQPLVLDVAVSLADGLPGDAKSELALVFGSRAEVDGLSTLKHIEHQSHGIDIFPYDTVDAFKRKVVTACHTVANKWGTCRRSSTTEHVRQYQSEKYRNVEITDAHVVMLFDPPVEKDPKATAPRDLHRMSSAGLAALDALRTSMLNSYEDAANWKPLNPTWTFNQCAARFSRLAPSNSKRSSPPLLRVIAHTGHTRLLSEINNNDYCFAYAQHYHKKDGNSSEWRPCIVHGPSSSSVDQGSFSITWIATSSRVISTPLEAQTCNPDETLPDKAIRFAHASPAILRKRTMTD
jgi:hypothetical protein